MQIYQPKNINIEYKHNVLIIGLGNVGMRYDIADNSAEKILTHSKSFFYHNKFNLVAGIDLNPQNRKEFERKYKCKSFKSLKEASLYIDPEIIIVSTCTNQHYINIKEILRLFKPKIIICEKPLSFDINEAKKIVEICAFRKIKLYVNYFRRTLPGNLEVLFHLNSNTFKKPFKGVCFYSKGLFNSASHFIDLFQFLFGKIININLFNKNEIRHDPEPDFNLKFIEGNITFISNQNSPIFFNYIDIIMQNGKLTFDNGGSEVLWRSAKQDTRFPGYEILGKDSKVFKNNFDKIQFYFTEQIYLAINGKDNFLCNGEEALETQKVLEKIKLLL